MPEAVNPADIGMEITKYSPDRETAKTAYHMLVSGLSLDKVCETLNFQDKPKLLELIDEYQQEEIEVYTKIYRTEDIVRLNSWLAEIQDSLRTASSKQQPSLISAGLRVLEVRTRLLNEMTGLTKPGQTNITYSIEGVDLSAI